jgi:hypothetical protein
MGTNNNQTRSRVSGEQVLKSNQEISGKLDTLIQLMINQQLGQTGGNMPAMQPAQITTPQAAPVQGSAGVLNFSAPVLQAPKSAAANKSEDGVFYENGHTVIRQGGVSLCPMDAVMWAAFYNPGRVFTYTAGMFDRKVGRNVSWNVDVTWKADDVVVMEKYELSADGKSREVIARIEILVTRDWARQHRDAKWVRPNIERTNKFAEQLRVRCGEQVNLG